MKDLILTEVKFIITTIILSTLGLTYFHFEFSNLENYKGLKDMLLRPFMYNFEGFVIIAWYLVIATCLFFMINEIYKYLKEKDIFAKKLIIIRNQSKKISHNELTTA